MPFYQNLSADTIASRIDSANAHLRSCDLCPRKCGVERIAGKTGFCGANGRLKISSAFPHHGEEPVLSGTKGSGAIFFSHCTLQCLFCQNHQISHEGIGQHMTENELANEMLLLQKRGCHNINLVTPTHYVPQILRTLSTAIEKGLSVPIVYNTSGYESVDTLELLDGFVDIYLPDIKYASNEASSCLSSCPDYVVHNREALQEMWRQVGPLVTDRDGIATQGLLVRHLVLPQGHAGSGGSLAWMAQALGTDVAISLMAQYAPLHRAKERPEMDRRITKEEYFEAVDALNSAGLSEGYIQDWQGMDSRYIINFLERKRERLT